MDYDKIDAYLAEVLSDIANCQELHSAQHDIIIESFFVDGRIIVFVQCGRKFGKTTTTIPALYLALLCYFDAIIYFFAPFEKQAKELVWEDNRLKSFLSKKLKEKYKIAINNGEMRIRSHLTNSFIKVCGTDNYEAYRGVNPYFFAIDEMKDMNEKFWEAFEPNMASHKATALLVGTPPPTSDNLYGYLANEARVDDANVFFHYTSYANPHIDSNWLDRQKQKLIARGEIDVWMREYMANVFLGGSKILFPMLDKSVHMKPYNELLTEITRSMKSWDFYVCWDPATASVMAALIVAIHKSDKRVYVMDEVYIDNQMRATAFNAYTEARSKWRVVNPYDDNWNKYYDYAETWFQVDIANTFDENINPCSKDLRKKAYKISLIREALLRPLILFSDKCVKTWKEMTEYHKDDKGNIAKENDHNIDNLRYILNAANYYTIFDEDRDDQIIETKDYRELRATKKEDGMISLYEHFDDLQEYYDDY